MAMFTLYCDDSGTDAKSDIAVAGCYVSTVEQWEHFKRNWQEINDRENFGTFHMTDFVGRYEQFSAPEWSDKEKRDRTVGALISTIKVRTRMGFSAAILKSAYDEFISGDDVLRERLGDNHYALAVRLCTGLVDDWRRKHGYKEPVQYVFDRMTKGRGDIDAMFNVLVSGKGDAMHRYGVYPDCWSFQDKAQTVQLQAADIWAYENFRYMRDCFMPYAVNGGTMKQPRRSYLSLRQSPTAVRHHSRRSLKELALICKSTPSQSYSLLVPTG
jgi:hypothetical protein